MMLNDAKTAETSKRSRIFFCDMNSRSFDRNDQCYSENLICEILEDDLYNIANAQLKPLTEYGRGWYTYTTDDQQRYVYVDRIECQSDDGWSLDGERWKEYGHEFTATELAEISGKSVQSVYSLARKLGRLPTPDELKAVRRGAPRKYH